MGNYGKFRVLTYRIQSINFSIFTELHTFQTFLVVCSLPSIISGLAVMCLPESPKFLMSRGCNNDAMKVFQKIHRMNNGAEAEYPVSQPLR